MLSASKFIDFFVYDILDCTLLIKKEKNFVKNIQIFNIKNAVEEILEILQDQMSLQKVKVEFKYKGFPKNIINRSNFLVKTDMKRVQ